MAPKKRSRGKDKEIEVQVEREYAYDNIDFNEYDDSDSGEDEDESELLHAWELPLVSSLHNDDEGNKDNGYESEKLEGYPVSEDEDDDSWDQNVKFNEKAEYGDVVLRGGMEFPSLEVFKEALKDFSIHLGSQFKFIKNDKVRCRAKCIVEKCSWEIYCSWNGKIGCFQIKTYKDEHTCSREFWIKNSDRKWVAKQLVPELRTHPTMKWSDAFDFMKEKRGVHVSEFQVYRAMRLAKKIVEGSEKEQYKSLADYCEELRRTNEGSTVELSVKFNNSDDPKAPGVFDHLYICLEACKRGFKAGCRPLIGLDGCFLKGYYGETKDTWTWFLTNLLRDLGDYKKHGWNFVSDQQKGLLPAIKDLMPGVHHRFCVRHLWVNFYEQFKNKELNGLLWAAARSTTMSMFNEIMEKLKRKNDKAWAYLNKFPPKHWSKAGFRHLGLTEFSPPRPATHPTFETIQAASYATRSRFGEDDTNCH